MTCCVRNCPSQRSNWPLFFLFVNLAAQFGFCSFVVSKSPEYWQQPVFVLCLFVLLWITSDVARCRKGEEVFLKNFSVSHYLFLFELTKGVSLFLLVLNNENMFMQVYPVRTDEERACVNEMAGSDEIYFHRDLLHCTFYASTNGAIKPPGACNTTVFDEVIFCCFLNSNLTGLSNECALGLQLCARARNQSWYAYLTLLYFEAVSLFIVLLLHKKFHADDDEHDADVEHGLRAPAPKIQLPLWLLLIHLFLDTLGAWVWTSQTLLWTNGNKTGTSIIIYCFFASVYNASNWILCVVYSKEQRDKQMSEVQRDKHMSDCMQHANDDSKLLDCESFSEHSKEQRDKLILERTQHANDDPEYRDCKPLAKHKQRRYKDARTQMHHKG